MHRSGTTFDMSPLTMSLGASTHISPDALAQSGHASPAQSVAQPPVQCTHPDMHARTHAPTCMHACTRRHAPTHARAHAYGHARMHGWVLAQKWLESAPKGPGLAHLVEQHSSHGVGTVCCVCCGAVMALWCRQSWQFMRPLSTVFVCTIVFLYLRRAIDGQQVIAGSPPTNPPTQLCAREHAWTCACVHVCMRVAR